MKKILLTSIYLAFATFCFSQQISRHVISSGGNYTNAGGHTISSTIGEAMISTLNSSTNTLTQGFQQPQIMLYGCTDPLADNYDASANTDDGSCTYTILGCTDTLADNYDASANTDDGSCAYTILGCTDPLADNYDATANTDDGSCTYTISGCTDPAADNYDASATVDDGSCTYSTSCAGSSITGLSVSGIIHDRAVFNFDNMNTYDATGSQVCRVDQIRIKYREVGTSSWSQKNMASPTGYDAVTGVCNSTQNTSKLVLGLSGATTYEWQVKVWYCDGQNTGWSNGPNFTTLGSCPNVANVAVSTPTTTKATFTWDASNGVYSFVRLKARPEVANPQPSDWFSIGGAGVAYGTNTCLLYTSPSPRDRSLSRMPSSA